MSGTRLSWVLPTLGILCFVAWRYFVLRKQRLSPKLFSPPSPEKWDLPQLVLASFLAMFLELALIRWIAVEIRVFAYVKNLALLLCFLGFGMGCALTHSRVRWLRSANALLGLLIIVRWPWYGGQALEGLSRSLGAGADAEIWNATKWNWAGSLSAFAVAGALLLLVTFVFIPLGQTVSRQLDLATDSLRAYSWNVAASLAGILVFFMCAWASLPPTIWLGAAFLGLGLLQSTRQERVLLASLIVPAILLLHEAASPTHFVVWTPYQQIGLYRQNFPDGSFERIGITVNHTGYQSIVDLSPAFLLSHPKLLQEPIDENPYNLPFRFSIAAPKVLIVGAGTGNDVAGALRGGSQEVDAVEIDPQVLRIGQREHPEHPYQSPRVSVHLTDARAFLRRAHQHYDLVLFGLLDSHTQMSDYSNMRIDNFVYTQEAFREARDLLTPNGVLFLKFQVDRDWVGKRLAEMLTETFGKPPVVFTAPSSFTAQATCFVVSNSEQIEKRLATDTQLAGFVATHRPTFPDSPPVAITTDDWPYLYQQGHWIPTTYFRVGVLVVLLAIGLYWRIPEARHEAPSLFFFSMGAGFLLLETQAISRLALYFGTTWQINGIVITALLSTILAANIVTAKQSKPWPRHWLFAALLAGLALVYFTPVDRIPGSPAMVGWILACAFAVPVFFAGLLFAGEFRTARSPSAALGSNMLGAVAGGLLENSSLIFGLHALLPIAAGLYLMGTLGGRTTPIQLEKGSTSK
jgi:SAM-dependent methyltransferase